MKPRQKHLNRLAYRKWSKFIEPSTQHGIFRFIHSAEERKKGNEDYEHLNGIFRASIQRSHFQSLALPCRI